MAHFYGSIHGNRGDATRMGTKESGFNAWAQSWEGRVSVSLWHSDGKDQATISIGGGGSTYYRGRSVAIDLTDVPHALDLGDPKIEAIWKRISTEFDKLNEEAPKAIARAERRQERERREQERERQRLEQRRIEFTQTAEYGWAVRKVRGKVRELARDPEHCDENGPVIWLIATSVDGILFDALPSDLFSADMCNDLAREIIREELASREVVSEA